MTEWQKRIEYGIQCPECCGIQITTRRQFASDKVEGFQCEECGCNWSGRIIIDVTDGRVPWK